MNESELEIASIEIANQIWSDINDRSGFDMDSLDEEITEEIMTAWIDIIRTQMIGLKA